MPDIWAKATLSIISVTHLIGEAITLADRVVVMSPGPCRIIADERSMPTRPPNPTGAESNALRRHLSGLHGSLH